MNRKRLIRAWWFLSLLAALAFFGLPALAQTPPPPPAPPASVQPSELDDELPPDVRQKLSPEQLHDVMVERAKHSKHGEVDGHAVDILVPSGFFLMIVLIVSASLYAGFRKDKQRHETLRAAIERGAAIPPGLLLNPQKPHSDFRRGVILVAVGLGLGILLLATGAGKGVWTASLIPTFMGAGYLIVNKFEQKKTSE